MDDEEGVLFADGAAWEAWLEDNHAVCAGVWLRIARKSAPFDSVRYPEVLEHALCFGWIDARRNSHDEHSFLQRFVPRRPRSAWSQINREKAERLLREGRMRAAGLAEVSRAQADGRWDSAYPGQRSAVPPEDLERELQRRPAAREFFATLSSQNRYAIIYRLQEAKRPQTRARRLERFIAMLEAGETLHPY